MSFFCPHCNSENGAMHSWAGMRVQCPACLHDITLAYRQGQNIFPTGYQVTFKEFCQLIDEDINSRVTHPKIAALLNCTIVQRNDHYVLRHQDGAPRGGRDCPKCMFSMIYLRKSPVLNQDYGYNLDHGVGFDPDDNPFSSALLGSPSRYLWRHFVEPLLSRTVGNLRGRRYKKILRLFPNTLICTHCSHLIKQL